MWTYLSLRYPPPKLKIFQEAALITLAIIIFFQLHVIFIIQLAPHSSMHNLFYESVQIYLFTLPSRLYFLMCSGHSSGQNNCHSINICGLTGRSEISLLTSSKRTILINSISKASLHLITVTSHCLSFYSKLQLSHPSLSPHPFSPLF